MYKLPILLSLIACTPRMHKAYRASITVAGASAQIVDTRMSQWAVKHGQPESNPLLFSTNPSPELMAVGGTLGVAAMFTWHGVVNRLPDRGPETEWVKDILATFPLLIEGFCVWRNIGTIGTDSWKEW